MARPGAGATGGTSTRGRTQPARRNPAAGGPPGGGGLGPPGLGPPPLPAFGGLNIPRGRVGGGAGSGAGRPATTRAANAASFNTRQEPPRVTNRRVVRPQEGRTARQAIVTAQAVGSGRAAPVAAGTSSTRNIARQQRDRRRTR